MHGWTIGIRACMANQERLLGEYLWRETTIKNPKLYARNWEFPINSLVHWEKALSIWNDSFKYFFLWMRMTVLWQKCVELCFLGFCWLENKHWFTWNFIGVRKQALGPPISTGFYKSHAVIGPQYVWDPISIPHRSGYDILRAGWWSPLHIYAVMKHCWTGFLSDTH